MAVFGKPGEHFVGTNDGVGAWSTRPKGHAGLWSRLILHFWALEAAKATLHLENDDEPNPVAYLQRAYELTKEATTSPNEWQGTTTACAAMLHYSTILEKPVLFVTNLGDSQILVIRPRDQQVVFKTIEQWHWFDCPRQLGTNSPDTPIANASLDRVVIEEEDIVLAMSDGVIDNLWEHEVVQNVTDSIRTLESGENGNDPRSAHDQDESGRGMTFVARELVKAAKVIAQDPFAESPFMERAVDEGLAMEGGKLDDISVVVARCKRRKG
ncbi:MAG: hypothetical protein M1817_005046 [Caeruleum heppii]|nr:MAG: hypothetical protein M1817_005046 [Caeruleum heppii]